MHTAKKIIQILTLHSDQMIPYFMVSKNIFVSFEYHETNMCYGASLHCGRKSKLTQPPCSNTGMWVIVGITLYLTNYPERQ